MDDIVEDLVLSPFREIAQKGKAAADNARAGRDAPAAEGMLKAANGLIRSADRAVAKLEPRCQRLLDVHRQGFVEAVKRDVEIKRCWRELKDFLWEFEDYLTVEDFDAEKFQELQSIIRKCAPHIEEALICLKFEEATPAPCSSAAPSVAADEVLDRRESVASAGATESEAKAGVGLGIGMETNAPGDQNVVMRAQSGPDLGLEGTTPADQPQLAPSDAQIPSRSASTCSKPAPSSPAAQPPPFPESSWNVRASFQADLGGHGNEADVGQAAAAATDTYQRRDRVPASPEQHGNESDLLLTSEIDPRPETRLPLLPPPSYAAPIHPYTPDHVSATAYSDTSDVHYQHAAFPKLPSPVSPVIEPHVSVSEGAGKQGQQKGPSKKKDRGQVMTYLPLFSGAHGGTIDPSTGHTQTQLRSELKRDTVAPNSRHSSTSESRRSSTRDSGYEPISPNIASHRVSTASIMTGPDYAASHGSHSPPLSQHPVFSAAPAAYFHPNQAQILEAEQPGLEVSQLQMGQEFDTGLIPVNMDLVHGVASKSGPPPPAREADCSIGQNSSFHQLKGFCEGAKEMMRGGEGMRKVRKLNYGTGAILAAKCKDCLFELEWSEVEADRNGNPSGNYVSKSSGVGFRLRFLSKSHLPVRTVEDQLYACLFCIQLGRTTEESDATVFFSQRQLFAHISRHPRPLPLVPGLNVIEAVEVPALFRNNYDLHLSQPPRQSDTASLAREIDMLPMATATETFKSTHGTLKLPPDRAAVLQFAVGAKIVGIEFPLKYGGEWAIGWCDNTRAVFPGDIVRLEPPPRHQIAVHQQQQGAVSGGGMSTVVRWKFNNRDRERGDWLTLHKGETISEIAWAHPEHWCWSGKNSKGKWGIFPQSHVDSSTLRSGTVAGGSSISGSSSAAGGGDGASVASFEKRRTSIFARMASRARPGSSSTGSSGNSFDTPRPSIY